jgi:hypothetical protein
MTDQVTQELNLTPKRIAALMFLASHPRGVYVSYLAESVLSRPERKKHGGYSSQMATRAGAGYVMPFIRAGIVERTTTDFGWGIVRLTMTGESLLKSLRDDRR